MQADAAMVHGRAEGCITINDSGRDGHFWPPPRRSRQSASMVLPASENTTGDKDFDFALNRAFQIDLEQSLFQDILSHPTVQETHSQMQRNSQRSRRPGGCYAGFSGQTTSTTML